MSRTRAPQRTTASPRHAARPDAPIWAVGPNEKDVRMLTASSPVSLPPVGARLAGFVWLDRDLLGMTWGRRQEDVKKTLNWGA